MEKVALHLSHSELALKGEMIMSADESIVSSIEKLHVPSAFSSGVPFPATSIGKWTEHVTLVHKQFSNWLSEGRPLTVWIPGLFNVQGLLRCSAEAVRSHVEEQVAG